MSIKHLLVSISLIFCACLYAKSDDNISIVDIAQLISDSSFKKAKELSENLLKENPNDDAAWYYLGCCYYMDREPSKALACWKKASELDPENNDYMLSQYNLLASAPGVKEYADSLALKMAEKWPDKYTSPYTLCLMGNKEDQNGQDSLAALHYQQALTMDPTFTPAILPLAEIYRTQNNYPAYFSILPGYLTSPYEEAQSKVKYLTYVLNLVDGQTYRIFNKNIDSMVDTLLYAHPADSSVIKLVGSWDMTTGRLDLAQEHFKELVRLYPESAECWQYLIFTYKGDNENIIKTCEEALKHVKKPEDRASLYADVANVYFEIGNKKKCFNYLERAKHIKPHSTMILNNYAYFLSVENRNLKKAEKMSREAIEQEPENATYLDTYAYILYLLKDYEGARTYFKKCMVYGGKSSKVILEHYSLTLKALGENDLADFYMNLSKQAK